MRMLSAATAIGVLLLLSVGTVGCRVSPPVPETMTPSPLPPIAETSTAPPASPTSTATPQEPSTPSPALTGEPTLTPPATTTMEPTPNIRRLQEPTFSYGGISFAVDPLVGDEVFVVTEPDGPAYVALSLAPEAYGRDVGCVTVYPVASYREGVRFGGDLIDRLGTAIEAQSSDTFPVLMAHILLRAQTRHLRFQNGAGLRAVVMKGQDTVYANNESLVYEFHGLTHDGRYYVAATFPIDAPTLLSACCDPADNTNEAAIPAPALPDDDAEAGALPRAYNREAERRLDALDSGDFTPSLGLLDELVASLLIAPSTEPTPVAADGVASLEIGVDYRGTWYRETFGYTKQGEKIAHVVLVMPESQVDRATADQIFGSIDFSSAPDTLSIREGREELAWTLAYVNDAPEGTFRGQFEPGTYYVAAAFIAAPLTREEGGQPADALYAGMTGGGASTDYRKIEIEPGENTITLVLTDADGWACPWLYVVNGRAFEKRTEILRNVRGKQNERTEISPVGLVEVVDGSITLMVAEEKDEITHLDELYVIVEGVEVRAEATPRVAASVSARDGDYLVIASGESHAFGFRLPGSFTGRGRVPVSVVASGFYAPLQQGDRPVDSGHDPRRRIGGAWPMRD